MKEEKFLSFYNTTLNNKNKNPLYLTWNKHKKNYFHNKFNKDISRSVDIKPILKNNDYYKDPFFLNEFNLKSQIQILKAINSKKMNLYTNLIEENLPTINNLSNSNTHFRSLNTDINDYYNRVFKMKPLFKKIKPVVDNKLNMRYAENEEQYKNIMEKDSKALLLQGKKVKNKIPSDYIKIKVDDIKTRIRFMKGIIDFSFPGFVLTKIKAIDKKLKKENESRYKSKDYRSPVEKRNIINIKRNRDRKSYLYECFNINANLKKFTK